MQEMPKISTKDVQGHTNGFSKRQREGQEHCQSYRPHIGISLCQKRFAVRSSLIGVVLAIMCANRFVGLTWIPSRMQRKRPLRHGGSCVPFGHTLGGIVISATCRSKTQRTYVANAVTSGAKTVAESLLWIMMKSWILMRLKALRGR